MEHLRRLARTYPVEAISFDPRFFDVPAKMLLDDGLPMVEIPQSVERMTPIVGGLLELIKRGELHFDAGDEQSTTLTAHVLNAVPRFNERGFTLQKSKSRGRIDGAVALALAIDRALHPQEPQPKPGFYPAGGDRDLRPRTPEDADAAEQAEFGAIRLAEANGEDISRFFGGDDW
jgi:phage terminase large subunit-like protein